MIDLVPYQNNLAQEWDDFVLNHSYNGTFLHTRKFLSYHKDRFKDRSFLVYNSKQELIAVFPAAEAREDNSTVISHPGITYGGIVAGRKIRGEDCIDAIELISTSLSKQGYTILLYKTIPFIYHAIPYQDDIYALNRINATRFRTDISSCVDLSQPILYSSHHNRNLKKARKMNLKVQFGAASAEYIWVILENLLLEKYNKLPVHNLDEILLLSNLFPLNIQFAAAVYQSEVVAGAVLFNVNKVMHTQYLVSSGKGQDISALHLLLDRCIMKAKDQNYRFFDFGISTEKQGEYLNEGLFRFKNNFGAGSVVHDFYQVKLKR